MMGRCWGGAAAGGMLGGADEGGGGLGGAGGGAGGEAVVDGELLGGGMLGGGLLGGVAEGGGCWGGSLGWRGFGGCWGGCWGWDRGRAVQHCGRRAESRGWTDGRAGWGPCGWRRCRGRAERRRCGPGLQAGPHLGAWKSWISMLRNGTKARPQNGHVVLRLESSELQPAITSSSYTSEPQPWHREQLDSSTCAWGTSAT